MRIVTLLTDFGLQDSYVAEVKGVLLSAEAKLTLVDITHMVPPYNIEHGAFQLLRSYGRFPKGTLHLAVVDPGVGTSRRCLYVRTKHHSFVGPDNGVLRWAVRDAEARDGKKAAVFEIPVPAQTGPTFHGRDIFAPFAARAALKAPRGLKKRESMEGRDLPPFRRVGNKAIGEVIANDHFGNLVTSLPLSLGEPAEGRIADRGIRLLPVDSYQLIPAGETSLVRGSHGFWEIACREASAMERLRVKKGAEVTVILI